MKESPETQQEQARVPAQMQTQTQMRVRELLNRGVENIIPSKEFLQAELLKGKKLRVYNGIDPTGPTLHVGHAIVLKKLRQFQDLGHKVILLMGDFTATIGDPTDKTATRQMLTEKEVKKNMALYKKQASTILNFSGKNKAEIKFNSTWLKKMRLNDILQTMSLLTVNQMIKRDMFDKRLKEGGSVGLHEFLYPVLQGYDSVALDVDVEIGGNDQMFNMLVGRDLLKKIKNKEKTTITMKLLADTTGKKMGKTEGNMVSLADTNLDMFGKIMSWTDDMILNGFELCTDVPAEEIEKMKADFVSNSTNPRDLKIKLAKEIVSVYHGAKKAAEAEENFIKTFSNKGTPDDMQEVSVSVGTSLVSILVGQKIVESNGEFKRLVLSNSINTTDGEEIKDFNYIVTKPITLKVGKRRFLKISLN